MKTYLAGQRVRYIHTLAHLPRGSADQSALEVGTTGIFNVWLRTLLGFGRADCTTYNMSTAEKAGL